MSVPESEQLAAVADQLAGRFPGAAVDDIRSLVESEHSRLESSRIRAYVPVLIEHSVRDRLRRAGYEGTMRPVSESTAAPPGGSVRAGDVPIETIFNARITLLNGGLGGGTS